MHFSTLPPCFHYLDCKLALGLLPSWGRFHSLYIILGKTVCKQKLLLLSDLNYRYNQV